MGIKKYLADVNKITHGSTDVKSIYRGTSLIFELSSVITCTPSNIYEVVGAMPYTTVNVDCDKAGDIYFEDGNTTYYYEVEWYKNNVYQGYLIVHDGNNYMLGPTTITVAAGDDIKFRFGTGGIASIKGRMTDASGEEILSVGVELI